MKKLLIVLLAIGLVAGVFVPTASAAPAWRGGGWGHRHHFHHGGCFGCGFVGGLVVGGVVGGALAAPYYYAPAPVYVAPEPYCYTQPGYWQQVPYSEGYYTQYQNVWVPPQTVCR